MIKNNMKFYKYTLLKQDGTIKELGTMPQQGFKQFYKILDCTTIEIIPPVYYEQKDCTLYGDEEGRFNEENMRNPHFEVIADNYDVVGNIIKEELIK